MALEWFQDLRQPTRRLRSLGDGRFSAFPAGEQDSPYDGQAALFDAVVGNPLYNRLVWRASPARYGSFAAEALADGDGSLLDIGCGTAVFTAANYPAGTRPLVLVDLFPDVPSIIGRLREQVAPGESLYATSLVAGTPAGTRVLQRLHRRRHRTQVRRIGGFSETVFVGDAAGGELRIHTPEHAARSILVASVGVEWQGHAAKAFEHLGRHHHQAVLAAASGQPIGKTRLLTEALHVARRRGSRSPAGLGCRTPGR